MRIFGGYEALQRAPYLKVQKHRLVVLKRWDVEAKATKDVNDKLEARLRELDSK
jgi:hypothetical protein